MEGHGGVQSGFDAAALVQDLRDVAALMKYGHTQLAVLDGCGGRGPRYRVSAIIELLCI